MEDKKASQLFVSELSEAQFPEWDTLVSNAGSGEIYYSSQYLTELCRATDSRFTILGVTERGELIGGIALYQSRHRTGTVVAPRLLLYYNGPVIKESESKYPSEQTSRNLKVTASLAEALADRRFVRLELQLSPALFDIRPFLQSSWSVSLTYTYRVPITDLSMQWQRVDKNTKRLIRRSESEGLTLTEDDDFESLYEMHISTHHRKNSPLYLPKEKFKVFIAELIRKSLAKIYHARLPGGEAVASQLVLTGPHRTAHIVCAGANVKFHSLGASAFLRWKSFEALANKHTVVDLTDASLNPVTRFKSQLAGTLLPVIRVNFPEALRYRIYVGAAGLVNKLRTAVAAERSLSTTDDD